MSPTAEEFTPQAELLGQMEELSQRDAFADNIRYGARVTAVRTVDAEGQETQDDDAAAGVRVSYVDSEGTARALLARDHVLLCTGGLQKPREVALPDEELFAGDIINGINSEVDETSLSGRQVCVLGMGAFAVENARTALEQGADHVTIVARKANLVIPRMLLAMGTVQRGGDTLFKARSPPASTPEEVEAAAERFRQAFDVLVTPYRAADAMHLLPDGLKAAVARQNDDDDDSPPGDLRDLISVATIPTASDFFFVAVALGRITVVAGEVESCAGGGAASPGLLVRTLDGESQQIDCDLVVKCYGFEKPDTHLAEMCGREHIHSPLYITPKILLMKGERNPTRTLEGRPMGDGDATGGGGAGARGGFDVGGSVVVMSDFYIEVYAYFRDHPQELPAVLELLPRPRIADDSYGDFGVGALRILDAVPALAPKIDELRAKYDAQVQGQYGSGLSEFLASNREDWRVACALLSHDGDEDAVPYMWDGLIQQRIRAAVAGRLPWPLGAVAARVVGLLPLSWLPMPAPPPRARM